jgi:SnoaL-like domain
LDILRRDFALIFGDHLMKLSAASMEKTIRAYFDACNSGNVERIAAYFTPDGTHYFPEGSPFGALRGARAIGECWGRCVEDLGSYWTVDNFCGDPSTGKAVIEWTHFKRKAGQILRGDEWYLFTPDGRIAIKSGGSHTMSAATLLRPPPIIPTAIDSD